MEVETIFIEPFLKVDFNKIVEESLKLNDDLLVILNQKQLMEGKDSEGNDLRPYYSEDPYFKTPEAAQKYIAWKQKITPNSKRNPDAPNLFINGYFHGSIFPVIGDKSFFNDSQVSLGKDLISRYPKALGANEESLEVLRDAIRPEMFVKFRQEVLS